MPPRDCFLPKLAQRQSFAISWGEVSCCYLIRMVSAYASFVFRSWISSIIDNHLIEGLFSAAKRKRDLKYKS